MFTLEVETLRRLSLGGGDLRGYFGTYHEAWVQHVTRNLTGWEGQMKDCRYLIHDRDATYTRSFEKLLESAGIEPIRLPPRYHAERNHQGIGSVIPFPFLIADRSVRKGRW